MAGQCGYIKVLLASGGIVLFSLSNTAPAQMPTIEACQFQPWPKQTRDQVVDAGPVYIAPVVGASETSPMTVKLNALANLWFYWRWQGQGLGAKIVQRVEIDKVTKDGTLRPFCRTEWVQIDRLGLTNRVELPSGNGDHWLVRIYERNDTPRVSIVDIEGSSIIVSGSLSAQPEVSPKPRLPFNAFIDWKENKSPICATNASVPSDARKLGVWQLPDGALEVPGTLYAIGGRRVYLRAASKSGPVRITLFAKTRGLAHSPVPICHINFSGTSALRAWSVAEVPWGPESSGRWFVKLAAAKGSGAIQLELMSERATPGVVTPETITSASSDIYSCMRGAIPQRSPHSDSSAAFFQGAYALTIRTHLPKAASTETVRAKIVDALLAAINNWRAACVFCSPYQFSVVDIDGTVYVPERMLQGEFENYRATFMHNYPWQKDLWREKYTGHFLAPSRFVPVSKSLRQRNRFCVQLDETESGFSARNSPLCRPTTATNRRERLINLTWPVTALDCTPNDQEAQNVVACWNQTDIIKFNLRDFSFYAGDMGTILLGDGTRRVDLIRVFTHEVGHWLGLGHLDGAESIMASRFSVARCIDDIAMQRVNAVAIGAAPRDTATASLTYD